MRVLIIDDEPLDAELTCTALRRLAMPIEVLVAHNGAAALDLLLGPNASTVDVVLADVQLPDIDGIQLLNYLDAQSWGEGNHPRMILLTGSVRGDDWFRQRCPLVPIIRKPLRAAVAEGILGGPCSVPLG